jgi:hypothetical protein
MRTKTVLLKDRAFKSLMTNFELACKLEIAEKLLIHLATEKA